MIDDDQREAMAMIERCEAIAAAAQRIREIQAAERLRRLQEPPAPNMKVPN